MILPAQKPSLGEIDFSRSPFIAIWETTRACALKCVHCRAEAIDRRDPNELTTQDAKDLLDEISRFGNILVVLTGGDPARRPDIFELVSYGAQKGLRMAMTPSATPEMSLSKVEMLKDCGLARLAVSLDGSGSEIHDKFRGVDGSFEWTMKIIDWARQTGLQVQINTTVTRHNINDMNKIYELLCTKEIALWSVFFLVPTGRGKIEDEIKGADYERVLNRLVSWKSVSSFDIKTTEAPHFRRVVIQNQARLAKKNDGPLSAGSFLWSMPKKAGEIGRASKGVNDGNGFVFISHTGEIYPSGFLPVAAGNVKKQSLVDIYRNSPVFKALRNPAMLKGKCGACEFNEVCGGSRARAYAVYGDYLAMDPFCVYIPKGYKPSQEEKKFW